MRYQARYMQIPQPTFGRWAIFDSVLGKIICYFAGGPEQSEEDAKLLASQLERAEILRRQKQEEVWKTANKAPDKTTS